MTPVLANEAELYFERGGPTYRFVQRLALRWRLTLSVRLRILGFLAITWFPLLLFAVLEGRALGSTPMVSLLLDFGTYARFFLGVPLLIVAELVVGPRLREAGLLFVQGGFVQPADYPAFDQAIARVAKWRESIWAELIILGLAVAGAWTLTTETVYGQGIAIWRSPVSAAGGLGVSFTGLWYHVVAVPILQFFIYRWLWRLFVWASFLWTVSRLKLDLVATHADQAGGLGFLGIAHASLGIFSFAVTSILSAEVAFLLVFENADIETFKGPYVALLVIIELLFLGPLLMFCPNLIRTKVAAVRDYTVLVAQHNRAFHEKWIGGKAPADEPFLGSPDISALGDLGNSFEYIRRMMVVPFSLRVVIQLAIMTSLPCLPLMLLVMPIGKIVELLSKRVI